MPLRTADQQVLVVVGDADLHSADHLRAQLIESLWTEPPSLVVDLTALEFCDLAGLDALHDAARAAAAAGVSVSFRGMSPRLSWLHATFPPRDPTPPPAPPRARRDTPGATRPGTPAPPEPGHARSRRRDDDLPVAYGAGRGGGRRRASDERVHAVPAGDTTRSAVCGARVWPPKKPWRAADTDSCPECAALLSTAMTSVHAYAAQQPPSARPRPQDRAMARRAS